MQMTLSSIFGIFNLHCDIQVDQDKVCPKNWYQESTETVFKVKRSGQMAFLGSSKIRKARLGRSSRQRTLPLQTHLVINNYSVLLLPFPLFVRLPEGTPLFVSTPSCSCQSKCGTTRLTHSKPLSAGSWCGARFKHSISAHGQS